LPRRNRVGDLLQKEESKQSTYKQYLVDTIGVEVKNDAQV
jgi:hypothetical protein